MNIVLRRLFAFGIDCGLLALHAGVLFFLVSPLVRPLFLHSPYVAELTGFLLLTLPFGLYFAISEASSWSASLGKRLVGLRTLSHKKARPMSFSQSMLRSMLKFLPWELAHFAIWHAFIFQSSLDNVAMGALVFSYGLVIAYIVGLVRKPHRTLYDRLAGTQVIPREK